jgi:hypothetical protein
MKQMGMKSKAETTIAARARMRTMTALRQLAQVHSCDQAIPINQIATAALAYKLPW